MVANLCIHRELELLIMIPVQLIKVGGHMPWDSETPEWLLWVRSSGCAAGDANQRWSHEFWSVWTSHFELVLKLQFLGQVVRKHQLGVCQRWMEQVSTTKVAMMQGPRLLRNGWVFSMQWNDAGMISTAFAKMIRMFGESFMSTLVRWCNNLLNDGAVPDRWSLILQEDERHPGVCKQGWRWIGPDLHSMLMPEQLLCTQRGRFFRLTLQLCWKFFGFELGMAWMRPCLEALSCHVGCTLGSVKYDRIASLELWLQQILAGSTARLGKDRDMIPAVW